MTNNVAQTPTVDDDQVDADDRYCGALEAEELTQRVILLEGESYAVDQATTLNSACVTTLQIAVLTLFELRKDDQARIAELEARLTAAEQHALTFGQATVHLQKIVGKLQDQFGETLRALRDALNGVDGIDPAFKALADKQAEREAMRHELAIVAAEPNEGD